ncbi:MAG: hypothetical protein ACD_12C00689G0001 [uncultured bacterium]|nr:MAG: hypothetical protein ACD_12C00689G0001 [uncultured bacterium]
MMKQIPEIEKQQKEFEDLPVEKQAQMRKTHQEGYDLREIGSQPITEFDGYLDQLFLTERFDAVKKTKLPVT